jgi:DNA-binding PadR family transcriptional regulator
MSARHAILGMLLDGPAHPYQIGDRLKTRLGPSWEINTGHLSNTIRGLEKDGLVTFVGFDERDQRRKVFRITQQGVAEVKRWWFDIDVPETQAFRQTLLLKIALAGPEALEDALRLCKQYEQASLSRINDLSRRKNEVAPIHGTRTLADNVVLSLSLSADIYELETNLELSRHAQKVIRWLLTEAVWPGTRQTVGARLESLESTRARSGLFERIAAREPEPDRGVE